MVDTTGLIPKPEDRFETAAAIVFLTLVSGAGIAGVTALFLLLVIPLVNLVFGVSIDAPGEAVVYAEIAAGLSMPVLAMVTAWYGYEMAKLSQSEIKEREAELNIARSELINEITTHGTAFDESNIESDSIQIPTKTAYREHQMKIAQMSEPGREAIHNYYVQLPNPRTIRDYDDPDLVENVLEVYFERRREALDKLGENFSL